MEPFSWRVLICIIPVRYRVLWLSPVSHQSETYLFIGQVVIGVARNKSARASTFRRPGARTATPECPAGTAGRPGRDNRRRRSSSSSRFRRRSRSRTTGPRRTRNRISSDGTTATRLWTHPLIKDPPPTQVFLDRGFEIPGTSFFTFCA